MLSRIRATSAAARDKGTLLSIETDYTILSGSSSTPPFLVRVLRNLARKDAEAKKRDPTASAPRSKHNPFLPYEPSMYVQHIEPAHVLLLNKFNVVDDHTLIVTREFEEQSSLLSCADLTAMWRVLSEIRGLVFYNAGRIAGASQPHKHLQHVRGPLMPGDSGDTPFDAALLTDAPCGEAYSAEQLRFVHAATRMSDCARLAADGDARQAGELSMARYMQLLRVVGVRTGAVPAGDDTRQPFPYNLLVTREWMMMVPRREECYEGVSVNSLGFVGCLLVRNEPQLEVVKRAGGMAVLSAVGFGEGFV